MGEASRVEIAEFRQVVQRRDRSWQPPCVLDNGDQVVL